MEDLSIVSHFLSVLLLVMITLLLQMLLEAANLEIFCCPYQNN